MAPTIHQRAHLIRTRSVESENGCWLWQLATNAKGYGVVGINGRMRLAHRVAYEVFRESIPEGLQIDHLCRVRHCVNPAHLEAVDCRTNLLRGRGPTAIKAAQTHCVHGHPFDEANTYLKPNNGTRVCRVCRNRRAEASRRKRRAAA
jgi:hypothetical protein